MVQKRDRFDWLGLRPGEEEDVDIGQVRVGSGFGGIGRHLCARPSDIGDERRERNLNGADAGSLGLRGPLAFVAVTLVAAIAHEKTLAVLNVCG